jgi:hypothetical protein
LRSNLASADRSEFVRAVDTLGRGVHDPILKLRFLRASIARYETADSVARRFPWPPVRRLLHRWLALDDLERLLRSRLRASLPIDPAARRTLRAARLSLAATVALAAAAVGTIAFLGWRSWRGPAAPVLAAAPAPVVRPGPAATLPDAPVVHNAALHPSAVWLVEKGDGWEQYSNGLRIETANAARGEPRRYRVFDRQAGMLPDVHDRPVGILFHTSESDLWPLEASFNESLRKSSHALVRYLRREKLYHYLVDRFGRVYRVVEEDGKANHAGHSVWSRDGVVYLNLNHAFLGISFETRWEGGRALPLTQAQLGAGVNLTAWLRERWQIAPEMCVVHGLTSVNARRHLIGHHLDWARGFPFAAFGLPDQYLVATPSVALFGFDYDREFLDVLGEPWSGVRVAEGALAEEASRQGRPLADLRREKRALYDRWLQEQAREDVASPPALGG